MSDRLLRSDDPALLAPLAGRTVAVLGYGNQGRAHAWNLRDSGMGVIVGSDPARAGHRSAISDGFEALSLAESAGRADLAIIALPDEMHAALLAREIVPALRGDTVVGFLHGFSVHHGRVDLGREFGVILVAPKGPGTTLRARYVRGEGIPALVAVHQNAPGGHAEDFLRAWGAGIGCARAGLLRTTFEEETVSDLFGEQAVLCGGVTALILQAFELLRENGFDDDVAYIECCHELKQVTDLIYTRGLIGMMDAISNTAEFGAHVAIEKLRTPALREGLQDLLDEIRRGDFARRMQDDQTGGQAWINARRQALREHPIEPAGEALRALMPWLASTDDSSHAS
jgi:ketol-acid reductoisomerase